MGWRAILIGGGSQLAGVGPGYFGGNFAAASDSASRRNRHHPNTASPSKTSGKLLIDRARRGVE